MYDLQKTISNGKTNLCNFENITFSRLHMRV